VAELKIQSRGGGHKPNRGRGKGRANNGERKLSAPSQRKAYLCFEHARFSDAMWKCEDPTRCTATTPLSGN